MDRFEDLGAEKQIRVLDCRGGSVGLIEKEILRGTWMRSPKKVLIPENSTTETKHLYFQTGIKTTCIRQD